MRRDDGGAPPVAVPPSTQGGNPFAEPPVLSSGDGVLELVLTAHEATADLDTVAQPVEGFLLFGYEVRKGSASDGRMTSDGSYPGPTLKVDPGDTPVVHLANELAGLTVVDFVDPAFTPVGQSQAVLVDTFTPFGEGYIGGLPPDGVGGRQPRRRQSIVAGQLDALREVKVFSTGNTLEGQPEDYTATPGQHGELVAFEEIGSLTPFGGSEGTQVATTSTTVGADLLVGTTSGGSELLRFTLGQAQPTDSTLTATLVGPVAAPPGAARRVGGD